MEESINPHDKFVLNLSTNRYVFGMNIDSKMISILFVKINAHQKTKEYNFRIIKYTYKGLE